MTERIKGRNGNEEGSPDGLKLSLREVTIGKSVFRLWVPAVADEVLEASISNEHANPYWATVWPAAERMAEFVTRHLPRDVSLLELGCGTGLVGIAALAKNVRVTFNDVVPEAVQLSLRNAHQNGFHECFGSVFDWNSPPDESRFDHIIGSDVLYETATHEPLLLTLDAMLSDRGEAWIADMGRGNAVAFITGLNSNDWSVTTVDEHGSEIAPVLNRFQVFRIRRS